jgi:heme/copper-type cytochrome/quinol oxidase subunit 2
MNKDLKKFLLFRSVIYVCVSVVSILLSLVLVSCCFKCRRRKAGGTRAQKYSRLDSGDMELTGGLQRKLYIICKVPQKF